MSGLEMNGLGFRGATASLWSSLGLFGLTALAELLGCYLPWRWLKAGGSPWLLLPAAFSLGVFVWLLSLHPQPSGRVYAAYGGVYIVAALLWLWGVDGQAPSRWDWAGVACCLTGVVLMIIGPTQGAAARA